jgi:hypothetical protein
MAGQCVVEYFLAFNPAGACRQASRALRGRSKGVRMPTSKSSLRHELPDVHRWSELKALYKDIHFNTPRFEAVEEYGVRTHGLDTRLAHLQAFWRHHVAPATHRPRDTHLAAGVSDTITRIAQLSYEVYANVCDALDQLAEIRDAEKKGEQPKAPRYRPYLNVLRCIGDACQLFDDLSDAIGQRDRKRQPRSGAPANLAKELGVDILLFSDWDTRHWAAARMEIADYRHMLVHHGRPWLFFDGEEFVGEPLVLKAEDCRARRWDSTSEFLTWSQQRKLFNSDRGKFITMRKACEVACGDGIKWLNRAYERLGLKMDEALKERDVFDRYKELWGC